MKVTLSIVVCILICTSVFASFPITENNNLISVATELPVSDVDGMARISMIFDGIAILFSIFILTSSGLGWGVLFFIMLAAIFYLLAFIFGLLGLRSKSKKWQAFIGLFSGLLVLLALAISAGSTGDPDTKD